MFIHLYVTSPSFVININLCFAADLKAGLCVCVKKELSWNFEGRMGKNAIRLSKAGLHHFLFLYEVSSCLLPRGQAGRKGAWMCF